MKRRSGFVSNSSSSSFIMISPVPVTEEMLTPAFGVPKESALHGLALQMARLLIRRGREYKSLDQYCDDKGWSKDEVEDSVTKAFEKGLIVYAGDIHDNDVDDGGVECALCNLAIHYAADGLAIDKRAGY